MVEVSSVALNLSRIAKDVDDCLLEELENVIN